jgi:hypothetical protein
MSGPDICRTQPIFTVAATLAALTVVTSPTYPGREHLVKSPTHSDLDQLPQVLNPDE